MTAPAAAKKNRWGSRVYPVPVPGSDEVVELPAVSRVLDTLASRQLEIWKLKTIATVFSQRSDLVMKAAEDPYGAAKQALDSAVARSNIGTAIHHLTEGVDGGTLIYDMVPAPAKPWVDTYIQAQRYFKWEAVYQEVTVFNHTLGYAGTADRFLRFPDGEIAQLLTIDPAAVAVADLKTGEKVWANQALQMFFYANGEGIWVPPAEEDLVEFNASSEELERWIAEGTNIPEGRRKWSEDAQKIARTELDELKWKEYARLGHFEPMPEGLRKDIGYILHLHEDTFELVPMDLSAAEEVVKGLCAMFHWTSKAEKTVIGKPLVPPPPPPPIDPLLAETVDALRKRANALTPEGRRKVKQRWPRGVPALKTGPFHNDPTGRADLEVIDALITDIEREVQAQVAALEIVQEVFPGAEEVDMKTNESNQEKIPA